MRRAAALIVLLAAACSSEGAATTTVVPARTPSTTTAPVSTTATPSATVASTTTAPPSTNTTAAPDGPPAVSMVPAGYKIEDFVPLVEGYFAVRNWALEHPDEATVEVLATVIEPGSVEMRDLLDEIAALVEQGARYEGLTETFRLMRPTPVVATTDLDSGEYSISVTVEFGDTSLVGDDGSVEADSLRRAPWTLTFVGGDGGAWRVAEVLRNPFDHAPGGSP